MNQSQKTAFPQIIATAKFSGQPGGGQIVKIVQMAKVLSLPAFATAGAYCVVTIWGAN